jgi:hypothetical protein
MAVGSLRLKAALFVNFTLCRAARGLLAKRVLTGQVFETSTSGVRFPGRKRSFFATRDADFQEGNNPPEGN